LRFEQSGDTFSIYAKPRYFNVFNWFNFQSTSFRIYIPTRLSSQTKTFGGDVSLKGIGGNHFLKLGVEKFWHKTPLVTSKEKRWVAKSN
jgi:hypothetical protein